MAELTTDQPSKKEKNPAAVALGRLGGLKGGKARAKKLSPERRKEIARNAAQTRWGKKRGALESLLKIYTEEISALQYKLDEAKRRYVVVSEARKLLKKQ